MKKILPICVVLILVLSGLGAVAGNINTKTNENKTEPLTLGDVLDQFQTIITPNAAVPVGQITISENTLYFQVAQSFIPTKEIITRVELYMGKNSTASHPLKFSIRDNLEDQDLVSTLVGPGQFLTEDFGWVEIDFIDMSVNIGQTYYLVCLTENVTDNFYAWGANNLSDSYPNGCAWFSLDEGDNWGNESSSSYPSNINAFLNSAPQPLFEEDETWDMCFKTYGRENTAPLAPQISGPDEGSAGTPYDYTFLAEDLDGDPLYMQINWGDGNILDWFGPFSSGDPQVVSVTYSQQGQYIISAKVRDIHDAESPWGTFSVTNPRNRANTNLLFGFFQNHPNLFPILRHILGL